VKTLDGNIIVTEVTLCCPEHRDQIFRPDNVMTPHRSQYGFDVIAEVGRLRFIEHKQVYEIQAVLQQHGLKIPDRTVQWLCDRYLEFVTAVHIENQPLLAEMFKKQGGYVLHIDGSGTKGQMVLLLREGWSGVNLFSTTVPTEGAEFVIPHLKYIKEHFGRPVAVLRDRSKGIETAVLEVFPRTYVISCHFHFLQDMGSFLFDKLYPCFRNRVDRRGVKKKLATLRRGLRRCKEPDEEDRLVLNMIEFIHAYREDSQALAYPFSLPAVNFYRRCEETARTVRREILARAKRNIYSPILSRLEDILRRLKPPPAVLGNIQTEFLELQERWRWFERIRRAFRYRNGPIPLSTRVTLSERDLEKGRRRLDWLLRKIAEFEENGGNGYHYRELRKALQKIARSIKENRNSLFAPNVIVTIGKKTEVKRVPRTNAPVEGEYRGMRRHGRRIRGCGDVESQFQRDGPGMLMVENLANKRYLSTVYGTMGRIPERFSKVSPKSLMLAKSFIGGSKA